MRFEFTTLRIFEDFLGSFTSTPIFWSAASAVTHYRCCSYEVYQNDQVTETITNCIQTNKQTKETLEIMRAFLLLTLIAVASAFAPLRPVTRKLITQLIF